MIQLPKNKSSIQGQQIIKKINQSLQPSLPGNPGNGGGTIFFQLIDAIWNAMLIFRQTNYLSRFGYYQQFPISNEEKSRMTGSLIHTIKMDLPKLLHQYCCKQISKDTLLENVASLITSSITQNVQLTNFHNYFNNPKLTDDKKFAVDKPSKQKLGEWIDHVLGGEVNICETIKKETPCPPTGSQAPVQQIKTQDQTPPASAPVPAPVPAPVQPQNQVKEQTEAQAQKSPQTLTPTPASPIIQVSATSGPQPISTPTPSLTRNSSIIMSNPKYKQLNKQIGTMVNVLRQNPKFIPLLNDTPLTPDAVTSVVTKLQPQQRLQTAATIGQIIRILQPYFKKEGNGISLKVPFLSPQTVQNLTMLYNAFTQNASQLQKEQIKKGIHGIALGSTTPQIQQIQQTLPLPPPPDSSASELVVGNTQALTLPPPPPPPKQPSSLRPNLLLSTQAPSTLISSSVLNILGLFNIQPLRKDRLLPIDSTQPVLPLLATTNPQGLIQRIQTDPELQLVDQQVRAVLETMQNQSLIAILNKPLRQATSIVQTLNPENRKKVAALLGNLAYHLQPFLVSKPNGRISLNLPIISSETLQKFMGLLDVYKQNITPQQLQIIRTSMNPGGSPSITGVDQVSSLSLLPPPPPPLSLLPPPPPLSPTTPSGPLSPPQVQNSQLKAIDQSILTKIRQLQTLRQQALFSKNKSQKLAKIKQSAKKLYTELIQEVKKAQTTFLDKSRFVSRNKQITYVYKTIQNIGTNQLGTGDRQSSTTLPVTSSLPTPPPPSPTPSDGPAPAPAPAPPTDPGPGDGHGDGDGDGDGAHVPAPGPGDGHGDGDGDGDGDGQIPLCTPQESSPSTTPMIPILLGVAAVLLGVVNTTIG